MNITINGQSGSGKTILGQKLANALNYNFIDLEKLYQRFDNENKFLAITTLTFPDLFKKYTDQNNEIKDIVKNGKCVIVGYDTTTIIIPNNDINIFMKADFNTRVNRKYIESDETNEQEISDMIKLKDDKYKNIFLTAEKIATIFDTTNKNVEESFNELYEIVMKTKNIREFFIKIKITLLILIFSIFCKIIIFYINK
jgi:cytidylate kinase